jgi:hypothetical protein
MMSKIRYISLSDLHLGEESSLLTNIKITKGKRNSNAADPSKPSPVMEQLTACLRTLVENFNKGEDKPTLILNGDALDLALAKTNVASLAFLRFLDLIFPQDEQKKLFKDIVLIPGNHDHHLWVSAREEQYLRYIGGKKELPDIERLEAPWHATGLFDGNFPSSPLLVGLIKRYADAKSIGYLKDMRVKTVYPNFGVINDQSGKCVIFHHGHYVEWVYHLLSMLADVLFPNRAKPQHVWDIEQENYAWIDFVWSMFGSSGQIGQDVENIYKKLSDMKGCERLVSDLAAALAEKHSLVGPDFIDKKIYGYILSFLVDKVAGSEKGQIELPLSKDAEDGLREYVNGPLFRQIETERSAKGKLMPSAMTFVFGHTHKPFQEIRNFERYPHGVSVYNTGGWVVETVAAAPVRGGAVVLVDDDLNAVSIQMYTENADPHKYRVVVADEAQLQNPLQAAVAAFVNPNNAPWNTFSDAVAREVYVRQQDLNAGMYK